MNFTNVVYFYFCIYTDTFGPRHSFMYEFTQKKNVMLVDVGTTAWLCAHRLYGCGVMWRGSDDVSMKRHRHRGIHAYIYMNNCRYGRGTWFYIEFDARLFHIH